MFRKTNLSNWLCHEIYCRKSQCSAHCVAQFLVHLLPSVSRGVSRHGHFHLCGHHASSQSKYSPGVFVCSHPQVGASCQLHGGPQHSQPPQQDLLGQPPALGQDRSPWVQPALIRRHGAEKGLRRVIRWCNAPKCENSDAVVWWGTSSTRLTALTDECLAAPPTWLIKKSTSRKRF